MRHCSASSYRIDGKVKLEMTWKSNDEKISISGDNASARVFIAVTAMEGNFHSICSIALLNSNCTV